MKKTRLFPLTLLIFALGASSCGELPPERAAQLDRERIDEESRNRSKRPLVFGRMNYDSEGQVDLEYTGTYDREKQVFTFQVSRANRSKVSREVTLTPIDQPKLFSALFGLFTGKNSLQYSDVCPSCRTDAELRLDRSDGSGNRYRYPTLRTNESGAENLIDTLATFILNRL